MCRSRHMGVMPKQLILTEVGECVRVEHTMLELLKPLY